MPASGPLFDGRAAAALEDYRRWAADQTAQQALAEWHLHLDRSLQHPTGRYESTIHMDSDPVGAVVHDDGLIYNYWLEGIGRRNAPVTRFAGYHSALWGTVATEDHLSAGLIDPIPARFMRAMGGV